MEFNEIYKWLKRKCQADADCMNVCERGYIYCINHNYGFPSKLPDEVIDYLKHRNRCHFPSEKSVLDGEVEKFTYRRPLSYSVDYEQSSIVDFKTEVTCNNINPEIELYHYLQWGNLRIFNDKEDIKGERMNDGLTNYIEY